MILIAQRVCVCFAAASTGVAPWGGEVTWCKPGDTSSQRRLEETWQLLRQQREQCFLV